MQCYNWNDNQAPSKPVRKQKRRQQEGDARFSIMMRVTDIIRMMRMTFPEMMMIVKIIMMMMMAVMMIVKMMMIVLAGLRPLPTQAPPATVPQVLDFR